MRGKINMPETIKNRLVRKQLLTCDYDELSENNLLNQIIKTAVMLLLRNAKVKAEYKDDLKKKMLFFLTLISLSQPPYDGHPSDFSEIIRPIGCL